MSTRTRRDPAIRRPMTTLTVLGGGAHVFFELAAGVAMPFASVLGPVPAAAGWAGGIAGLTRAAATGSATNDRGLAVFNGITVGAIAAHLAAWPKRRTRLGLPWLEDCEGLGPELMPYYNSILYASMGAAVAAIATENRSSPRSLSLLVAVIATPLLVKAQHVEFRRLLRLAGNRPGWWNRRLRRWLAEQHRPVAGDSSRAT